MKEGWEIKRLGDIASYINGFAFKPSHWSNSGLPIVRIQNLTNSKAAYNYCEQEIPSKFIINRGDVLISWSASLGVYESVLEKALLNQHIFKVVFNKGEINKKYFQYAVSIKIAEMQSKCHGATMRHIVKKDFDNTLIPIPPLTEQERIVEVLDREFERIDTIQKNAETSLQYAKDLMQRWLETIEIPQDSSMLYLKDITIKIGSGATPKGGKKSYISSGTSLIRSMNVHNNNFLYKDLAYINEEQANSLSNVEIIKDDVLFNITGASITRCCVVPSDVIPARVNQHVCIIRPRKEIISSKFLCLLLIGKYHKTLWDIANSKGATRQALTKAQLENLILLIPNIQVQNKIELKFNEISENCRKVEENSKLIISHCDALKQALLRKAFEGKL